jgi:hemoglobin
MMVDPIIKPFFEKTDMPKQHKAQKAFITMITGGPNHYEGADMKKAHQGMNIGKKEFDATWFHLNQSLTHHKVPEALIKQVYEAFYSFEADIV